jgi:hypothetical protein
MGYRLGASALYVFLVLTVLVSGGTASAVLTGFLTTADGGLVGGSFWQSPPGGEGFQVDWTVSVNPDGTWRYVYEFSGESGLPLEKRTSHFIISLSENIDTVNDLFNFTGDVNDVEFGTFGPSTGNPGFPEGEAIFGMKINLVDDQNQVGFDSNRQPMWGDFYAKDGGNPQAYTYNFDFGVEAANVNEYDSAPVDTGGQNLSKVLTPDTIPEPATLTLLGLCGAVFLRRRRPRRRP